MWVVVFLIYEEDNFQTTDSRASVAQKISDAILPVVDNFMNNQYCPGIPQFGKEDYWYSKVLKLMRIFPTWSIASVDQCRLLILESLNLV